VERGRLGYRTHENTSNVVKLEGEELLRETLVVDIHGVVLTA